MKFRGIEFFALILCLGTLVFCSISSKMFRPASAAPGLYSAVAYGGAQAEESADHLTSRMSTREQRAHAWGLLSALTHGGAPGNPDWESWLGKCAANTGNLNCPQQKKAPVVRCPDPTDYSNGPAPHIAPFLETPIQLDPELPAQPDGSHVSAVLYNGCAIQSIRNGGQSLTNPTTWLKLLAGKNSSDPSNGAYLGIHFDTRSIVVKEIYEVVDPCDDGKTDCWNPVYIWDPTKDPDIFNDWASKNNGSFPSMSPDATKPWATSVLYVNNDTKVPCDMNRDYPTLTVKDKPQLADRIPISCFHYIYVPKPDGAASTLRSGVGITLNKPHGWSPKQSTYLVLVGFHISTAEVPNWFWSTFWWTNHPHQDPKTQDQPKEITGSIPWSYYSMDSFMNFGDVPDAANTAPPIVFNPYLEGFQPNGYVSNCLYCHQRAVFRDSPRNAWVDNDLKTGSPPRCAFTHPVVASCGWKTKPDAMFYTGAIRTNFLWSLAIRQDPTALNDSVNSQFLIR